MLNLAKKIFGLTPEAALKKLWPVVRKVEAYEDEMAKQSDEYFAQRIKELSQSVNDKDMEYKALQQKLDEILPEVFAIVREASWRVLNMKHYPVQLLGGVVLHKGKISEMKTGEGKTLVATAPAVLNAMTGRGVHIVTVNDYLAKRDSEWMGRLYQFLGLSVGLIHSGQDYPEKLAAYNSDILYSTNNELGFDYLRDNMASSLEMQTRRKPYFAIVDEVDSVLIDEARTPLIISGAPESGKQQLYLVMNQLSTRMVAGEADNPNAHYSLEEKHKNIVLSDKGIKFAEDSLGIEDLWDIRANLAHHLLQALKAKEFFKRDSEYVVQMNPETNKKEVVIVDEFTGRLMNGRRWSDGLHQAVEAKENVPIQEESLTLASITFQNFFRLYPKLAGMTGTALTEAEEFSKIYSLEVLPIPTHRDNVRKDLNDQIYKNEKQKFYAILEEVITVHKQGRPILVGTTNIDKSEMLSEMLSRPQASVELLQIRGKRLVNVLEADYPNATVLVKGLKKLLDRPVNIKYQNALDLFQISLEDIDLDASLREIIESVLSNLEPQSNDSEMKLFVKTFLRSADVVETIRNGVQHNVLNAKHHEKEASIIAQAGRKGAVTIATNMAGRGTDIVLGGNADFLAREQVQSQKLEIGSLEYDAAYNEALSKVKPLVEAEQKEVLDAGGLHIIGTERHESRRIDNQLRGRASRQGDPGSTKFYLGLDDQLMRIFGGDKLLDAMNFLKTEEDFAIEAKIINKGIEGAQKKVEGHNYEIRKRLLEYDDVSNTQRQWVYDQRQQILEGYDLTETFDQMISEQIESVVYSYLDPEKPPEVWYERVLPEDEAIDMTELSDDELEKYPRQIDLMLAHLTAELHPLHGHEELNPELFADYSLDELIDHCKRVAISELTNKKDNLGDEVFGEAQRYVLLRAIDDYWVEHLQALDSLKAGIHLRGYGNKQPLVEYKKEAFEMFDGQLYSNIRRQAVQWLFQMQMTELSEEESAEVVTA